MAEAKIDISAADRNVLTLIQTIAKGMNQIAENSTKVEKATERATKSSVDGLDKMARGVGKVAMDIVGISSVVGGVTAAWKLANSELDHYIQQNERARQLALPVGAQIAAAIRNAPDGMGGGQIEEMAKRVSAQSGIPIQQVTGAMASTFAAGGKALTAAQYESVFNTAGPISVGSGSEFAQIATSTALFKAQAGKGAASDKAIAGFLMQAGSGSIIDRMEKYAPLAGNINAAAITKGFDPAEAIAIFNATTKGTNDLEGPSSRTANIQYLDALDNARKQLGMPTERSPYKIIQALRDPKNASINASVMNDLRAEVSHKPFMQSITGTDTIGQRFVDEAISSTPTFAQGEATYDQLRANLRSSPLVRGFAADQSGEAAIESQRLSGDRSYAGTAQDKFEKLIDESTLDVFDRTELKSKYRYLRGTADPFDFAENLTRGMAQNKQNIAGKWWNPQSAADRQIKDAETLLRIADTLDRIQQQSQPSTPAANGDRPVNPLTNRAVGSVPEGGRLAR